MSSSRFTTLSFEGIKRAAIASFGRTASGGGWALPADSDKSVEVSQEIAAAVILPAVRQAMEHGTAATVVALRDGRRRQVHSGVEIEAGRLAQELRQRCVEIIERWDVRQVNRLVDLFPECVPATCRLRHAVCEMADDEDGSWMVTFDLQSQRHRAEFSEGSVDWALGTLVGGLKEESDPMKDIASLKTSISQDDSFRSLIDPLSFVGDPLVMGTAIAKASSLSMAKSDQSGESGSTITAVEAEAQRKRALANELLKQISERKLSLEKIPHHLVTPQMRLAAVKAYPGEFRFINPTELESDETLLSYVAERWSEGLREQVGSFSELKVKLIERILDRRGNESARGDTDSAGDAPQGAGDSALRPRQR
jgi:hypothetical protein